jgi:hypothetical protein
MVIFLTVRYSLKFNLVCSTKNKQRVFELTKALEAFFMSIDDTTSLLMSMDGMAFLLSTDLYIGLCYYLVMF